MNETNIKEFTDFTTEAEANKYKALWERREWKGEVVKEGNTWTLRLYPPGFENSRADNI